MSVLYRNHGRKHTNGEDPIPGLAGFPATWIFGIDNAISVLSRSTPSTHYDFTPSTWDTNDSSVFDVVTGTGVTINGPGFYVAMIECEWADGAGDVTKAAEMIWNISGEGNELHDAAAFLPDFMAGWAITKAVQGFPLDITAPTTGADLVLRQTSGATASVSMQFAIVRLTDDYGSF